MSITKGRHKNSGDLSALGFEGTLELLQNNPLSVDGHTLFLYNIMCDC